MWTISRQAVENNTRTDDKPLIAGTARSPKNSNIRQARNPYVILTFLSGLESYKCQFISVGFSRFRETPIGKRHEVSTGDGGVLAWRFPSYNSVVITETLLKPTSSLDSLLER